MMKRLLVSAILALGAAAPALAEDLTVWGQSGDWTILRDPNHGNGCLVQATLSDGSTLRIGFEKKGDGLGYISSFNPFWAKFDMSKEYDVTVKFGDQLFVGKGKGATLADMPGVVAKSDSIELLVALAKSDSVNLSTDGGEGLTVKLAGSNDALAQALTCQAA